MQRRVDVSFEFSHIYADQSFGRSQQLSLERFKQLLLDNRFRGKTFSSVVLVDDVHVKQDLLIASIFQRQISRYGIMPDCVVPESTLKAGAITIFENIKSEVVRYEQFRKERKTVVFLKAEKGPLALGTIKEAEFFPTCALLVATWHLSRLGVLPLQGMIVAHQVVSILENQFKEIEEKALQIVKATEFSYMSERISHEFYLTPEEQEIIAA